MQAPKCKLASSPGAQPRNSEQPAPKLGASQLCWPRGQRICRLKHVFAAVTGPGTSALNKVEVDSSHVTVGRCGGPAGVRGAGAGPGPSQQEGEGRGGDLLCLDRTHWTVSRHFRPQTAPLARTESRGQTDLREMRENSLPPGGPRASRKRGDARAAGSWGARERPAASATDGVRLLPVGGPPGPWRRPVCPRLPPCMLTLELNPTSASCKGPQIRILTLRRI